MALSIATTMSTRPVEAQLFGSDPESVKRTDRLIEKAEEVVEEAAEARTQIGKTLETYNAIFAKDTEDIPKTYKRVESEMKKTEKQREDVRKKLAEMTTEAEAYFAGWGESLREINDPDLRKRSESRMTETRAQLDGIMAAVREAREAYEPFMTRMKDQWVYLGHDLNPSGIESLKPDVEKLNAQAKELFQKIDAGTEKAGEYITSLRASRPVS